MQDYKKQVLDDIREWAKEGNAEGVETVEELRDRLQDPSWSDSITGNATGSYYCNTYKAQEMVQKSNLIFDEDFLHYLDCLGCQIGDIIAKGAETLDVWARCAAVDLLTDEELEEACGLQF